MGGTDSKPNAFYSCCSLSYCRKDALEVKEEIPNQVQSNPNPNQVSQKVDTEVEESKENYLNLNRAKLKLKILNSSTLQRDLSIEINSLGLVNSLRNKFDGMTFFGSKKRSHKCIEGLKVYT